MGESNEEIENCDNIDDWADDKSDELEEVSKASRTDTIRTEYDLCLVTHPEVLICAELANSMRYLDFRSRNCCNPIKNYCSKLFACQFKVLCPSSFIDCIIGR